MVLLQPNSKVDLAEVAKRSLEAMTGLEVTDSTWVIVPHREFFGNITRIIDRTPLQTTLNYLAMR